jgi:hypothetical protein
MSDPPSLIPITDERAKAIQEAFKALQSVGGFLREVLDTVPEDLVGYLGGEELSKQIGSRMRGFLSKVSGWVSRNIFGNELDYTRYPVSAAQPENAGEALGDKWVERAEWADGIAEGIKKRGETPPGLDGAGQSPVTASDMVQDLEHNVVSGVAGFLKEIVLRVFAHVYVEVIEASERDEQSREKPR